MLRQASLVTVRAEGNRRLYALDPAGIAAVSAWLDALTEPKASFAQPLDALATEIARGRHARRRSTTPTDDTGNRAETAGREPA